MISAKTGKAINKQINAELFSSYLYLSMSSDLEAKYLPGMANWMRVQAQEELVHAMKFYDFINECNGRVILKSVGSPGPNGIRPCRCSRMRTSTNAGSPH